MAAASFLSCFFRCVPGYPGQDLLSRGNISSLEVTLATLLTLGHLPPGCPTHSEAQDSADACPALALRAHSPMKTFV